MMGISPIHDGRQSNGRFDSTVKALTSTKRRRELGHAAKAELKSAKKNFFETCATKENGTKFLKLFLMIIFYFLSSIALTFYQKQLIVVSKICILKTLKTLPVSCSNNTDRIHITDSSIPMLF